MQATHRPPVYRCIDCNRPIEGSPPTLYLCPSCEETAAQAQRDHRVREAAHELLAALDICYDFAQSDDGWRCPKEMHDAIDKAIAKARGGAT